MNWIPNVDNKYFVKVIVWHVDVFFKLVINSIISNVDDFYAAYNPWDPF